MNKIYYYYDDKYYYYDENINVNIIMMMKTTKAVRLTKSLNIFTKQ